MVRTLGEISLDKQIQIKVINTYKPMTNRRSTQQIIDFHGNKTKNKIN